jgi:hypothetical protein
LAWLSSVAFVDASKGTANSAVAVAIPATNPRIVDYCMSGVAVLSIELTHAKALDSLS